MISRCLKILFIVLIGMILGCSRSGLREWTHFHGNLMSQGYQPFESGFALSSAWISGPYNITSSSPVIGKTIDGREVLYFGTADGTLVCLDTFDGTKLWHHRFKASGASVRIVSSPAVSKKGDIFIITNQQVGGGPVRSTLHKVNQYNNIRWSFPIPDNGYTTGSPKVVNDENETLIFIYATVGMINDLQGELFALRDGGSGVELLDRQRLGICRYIGSAGKTGTQTVLQAFKTVWDFVVDYPAEPAADDDDLPDGFLDPTIAVNSAGEKWLVAVADNLCSFGAFEWDGRSLSVLWRESHDGGQHSSTMLLPNGLMIFGRQDGKVLAYDAGTGVKIWEYDAGQPVLATPAAPPAKLVFVVATNQLHTVDAVSGSLIFDEELPRKLELDGNTYSSPAVTENRVYLSTREMLTLSHDLKTRGHDTSFVGNRLSSVAVGRDGAVYAISLDGRVCKYSGTE